MNEHWLAPSGDRVEVFRRFVLSKSLIRPRVKGSTWHWHVRAANGEIVAASETYSRRTDAMRTAERLFPRGDS